jgi:hypothetical protein
MERPSKTYRVSFQKKKKNKFEKLVHLVGFTIEIYYDARPCERQMISLSAPVPIVARLSEGALISTFSQSVGSKGRQTSTIATFILYNLLVKYTHLQVQHKTTAFMLEKYIFMRHH